MKAYILAIDQGTTSTRSVLLNRDGLVCASAQLPVQAHFPQPGYVLQDPKELLNSVVQSMKLVLQKAGIRASEIEAAGLTNQRETSIVWDIRTGEPIYPAIVWQSRQSADIVQSWNDRIGNAAIRECTGLVPDAYFSASKIAWILKHVDGAQTLAEQGYLRFGTVDSWLLWHFSEQKTHATDATNASRTMLFNIDSLSWDSALCELMGIPEQLLPEIRPSVHEHGFIPAAVLGADVPLLAIAGDQHAALFGQACFSPGMVKNTYGTGCFMLMNTGDKLVKSDSGLLSTLAWSTSDSVTYALEGSVFVAGSAVQWLRDAMGVIKTSDEAEALAGNVSDNGGVYVVPAFTGLGAPYWDQDARGAVFGLTRGSTAAHLTRAVLESIAYQTRDMLGLMSTVSGIPVNTLSVDGGAAANNWLMQFQANQLQCAVSRPSYTESTVLGIGYMAGWKAGFWSGMEEIASLRNVDRDFIPEENVSVANSTYLRWKKAVEACRSFR
jgi:glycerol kinase